MVLVDTSIWIDHLRSGDEGLITLLNANCVYMHPFVLGELACGNLRNRSEILALFKSLPPSLVATDNEALLFIEKNTLMGYGIGYVDAHLLAAVKLEGIAQLWTRDKRLNKLAIKLGLNYEE